MGRAHRGTSQLLGAAPLPGPAAWPGLIQEHWKRRQGAARRPPSSDRPSPPLTGAARGPRRAGPAKIGELSKEVATGVAIRKGESDPKLLPDDQYPPWLFELLTPEPSTAELQRQYEQDRLTLGQMKRLFRYKNKQRIREDNATRAKK